ncbi:MAG: restriction endonuclease subunit S [Cytophagales bacterium]
MDMKQGWEIKRLGDVCETGAGGTPLKTHKDYYEGGTIPWLLSGEVSQGEIFEAKNFITEKGLKNSSAKLFPPNTVLVAMYGATAGQVGILRFEAATNQAVCGILPNDKIIPEYLFYCFLEKKEELIAQAVGGAQPNISQIKIKNTKIPLPPLSEQQRIVSILDEAFAAIAKAKANAERCLSLSKALFESYLQGVFEKKGEGWEEKTIGEIGNPKMCKRIFKEQTTTVGDIPFYKIGTFGKEPDAYISKEIYDEFRAKYSFPKKGDVLISASGTIGRRVRYDGEPAYFQDSNIVWIENDEKQVSNDFLFEFYGACNWGSTKGATISRLYNDNLKSIKISFPKSHKVQQTIVQQLNVLRAETQKLEAVYQKKIADLEELKKSILQKAFAGELPGGADTERSRSAEPKTEKSRRDDKIIEKMTTE